MNKIVEYNITRKELIKICREHFGIDFKDDCKLSSVGLKLYE